MKKEDLKVGMKVQHISDTGSYATVTAIGEKAFLGKFPSGIEMSYFPLCWEPVPEDKYIVVHMVGEYWDISALSGRGVSLERAKEIVQGDDGVVKILKVSD